MSTNTSPSPSDGPSRRLPPKWRRWLLLLLPLALIIAVMAWLLSLALRYPWASMPALVGAMAGWWFNRRSLYIRPFMPSIYERGFGRVLIWALPIGIAGYAMAAWFRLGVPAPDAPIGARLFGASVFGALAGVAATWLVLSIPLLLFAWRVFRRRAA